MAGDRVSAVVGVSAAWADVAALCAALSGADDLPDEPTLAQAQLVRPQVAAALDLPVGPALAAGVDAVMGMELSERERTELVRATTQVMSYLTAAQHTTLADLVTARDQRVAREVLTGDVERWAARSGASSVGAEIAPILHIAPDTATRIVSAACYTDAHLPAVIDAMAEGTITPGQASVVVEVARAAADHLLSRLEAKAVAVAPHRTTAQLRDDLESLAADLDPDHHAQAVGKGVAERDVRLGKSPLAGCKRLIADLPAEHGRAVIMWIGALAHAAKAAGDVRRIGQLRADLMVAALTGVLRDMLTTALAAATSSADSGGDGEGGKGSGGELRLPVPTQADLARLIELNIIITDPGDLPDDDGTLDLDGDDPDEPGEPGEPGEPDDDGPGDDGPGDDDGDPDEGGSPGGVGESRGAAEGCGADANEPTKQPEHDEPAAPTRAGSDAATARALANARARHDADARRQADLAAVRALLTALTGWSGPDPGPTGPALLKTTPAPRVPVIIRRTSLAGGDERPAHLPGDGPLPARRVRDLAATARYRWLHADPDTGYLIHRHARAHPPPDPGHTWTSRRPPASPPLPGQVTAAIRSPGYVPGSLLRAHVQTRDATCIGVSCHHPAHHVDLDHVINFGKVRGGVPGATTASNLAAECRRVHLLKTHGGWRLEQPTPGHFTWTTPLGHTYHRTATPLIPSWNEAACDEAA